MNNYLEDEMERRDKKHEADMETASCVIGMLTMILFALTTATNRGDESVLLDTVGNVCWLVGGFIVGWFLSSIVFLFARDLLQNKTKPILIISSLIAVAVIILSETNLWGDSPIWNL